MLYLAGRGSMLYLAGRGTAEHALPSALAMLPAIPPCHTYVVPLQGPSGHLPRNRYALARPVYLLIPFFLTVSLFHVTTTGLCLTGFLSFIPAAPSMFLLGCRAASRLAVTCMQARSQLSPVEQSSSMDRRQVGRLGSLHRRHTRTRSHTHTHKQEAYNSSREQETHGAALNRPTGCSPLCHMLAAPLPPCPYQLQVTDPLPSVSS